MDLLTAYNGLLIRFGLYQLIFGQRWATMLLVTLPNGPIVATTPWSRLWIFGILGLAVYLTQKTRADADSA